MVLLTEEGYKNKEKYLADINNTIMFTGEDLRREEWAVKPISSPKSPMSQDSLVIERDKRVKERLSKALGDQLEKEKAIKK